MKDGGCWCPWTERKPCDSCSGTGCKYCENGILQIYHPGASKRDVFALGAMVCVDRARLGDGVDVPLESVAEWVFDMAAAMLAESERRKNDGKA